jgi:molybdopterin-synthase adenylyltransferase
MTNSKDFSRQSFLGAEAEDTLAQARVAIVGLGGGGSHVAQQLAHIGVGHFRLIDPDIIEPSNLNRLVGATFDDVVQKRKKVEIISRVIKSIRPWATIITAACEWQSAVELLQDSHVTFGCVDGYRQRRDLEQATRRFCLPYIDIGMDVAQISEEDFAVSGQMLLSMPGQPCMTCMGFLTQDRLNEEENKYGHVGINPQVVWPNALLAALAVGTFMKITTPWMTKLPMPLWLEFEGNSQQVRQSMQPKYNVTGPCNHFDGETDLGDPFFKLK